MKNKIGVVLPYQNGDLITATAVIHYRKELWGDADIVWFCNEPHSDALKYQDIEIRYFPHGWDVLEYDIEGQYAERVKKDKEEGRPEWEDWVVLKNPYNRLDQELKNKFNSFKDIHEAYFPAPWMLTPIQRHSLSYPQCSKHVFGVPMDWEWHPVLMFSDEEKELANGFIEYIKSKTGNKYILCIESFAGSGQSLIEDWEIRKIMEICTNVLGNCSFIFMSHKYLRTQEEFPLDILAMPNVFSAKNFTVRQCALIVAQSDILISVSSGISVAASCWENMDKPFKTLQICGSEVCSTREIYHNRHFELVTHDDKILDEAYFEMNLKLYSLLNEIK